MDQNDFGEKLVHSVQTQILKGIGEADFVEKWAGVKPLKVPQNILDEAFSTIDQDRILSLVREGIEDQIAKTLLGQMLTEVATDTKKLMSDPQFRDRLRSKLYPILLQEVNSASRGD